MAILMAGETTVRVRGGGKGGRNQELALSAALGIAGLDRVSFLAVATDGKDGPTDAAGGWADGATAERAKSNGVNPELALEENDSYAALSASGDLLETGPTGTNVADLCVIACRGHE